MEWKERLVRFRSFWIFPALAIIGLTLTHRVETGSRIQDLLWLLPVGLFGWTLLEYGLHRFVFHTNISDPALRRFVNASHLEHHQAPRDIAHLLVCTSYAITVSALLTTLIVLVVRNWFWTAGVMSGVWAGFLYYESVHYRVHATSANGRLIRWQRHRHFHHHYHHAGQAFGVTTPLWDYVFGTRGLVR